MLVYLENLAHRGLLVLQETTASPGMLAQEAFQDSKGHQDRWEQKDPKVMNALSLFAFKLDIKQNNGTILFFFLFFVNKLYIII